MNTKITSYGRVFCILLAFFIALPAFSGTKKVLVEDHTGAWCGWCVLGNQAMEDMKAQYGAEFIPVAVHNADGMATSFQIPLAMEMQVGGYPAGSINRLVVSGQRSFHPVYWPQIVEQLIGQPAVVDVAVDLDYNKTTGALTAKVKADVQSDHNGQLSFNLYVMENGMSGSGQQWDQNNYVSGDPDYPTHPYYTQDPVLSGYLHQHVLRDMLGGLWGINGTFPNKVKAGESYEHTFTTNVGSLAQDKANIYVVAVIHDVATKNIMNSIEAGITQPTQAKAELSSEEKYISLTGNNAKSKVTISNPLDVKMAVDVEVVTNESFLPAGWDVSLSKKSFTINAKQSMDIDVTLTSGGQYGMAMAVVKVTPKVKDHANMPSTIEVFGFAESTKTGLMVGADQSITPLYNSTMASGKADNVGLVLLNAEAIQQFDLAAKLDMTIISIEDKYYSLSDPNNTGIVSFVNNMLDMGKDVFLSCPIDFMIYGGAINQTPSDECVTLFGEIFDVDYTGAALLYEQPNISTIKVTGVAGDDISNGLSYDLNNDYSQQTHPFYINRLAASRLNSEKTKAIIHVSQQGLDKDNAVTAFKYENDESKAVVTFFNMHGIGNTNTRDNLVDKMLIWLKSASSSVPDIALSTTSLTYGDIELGSGGSVKSFDINNNGEKPLVISGFNFTSGGEVFSLENAVEAPATIQPGQSLQLQVNFEPTEEKSYTGKLEISSDDPDQPTSSVNLSGKGMVVGSVGDGIAGNEGIFTMQLGPNPVTDNSVLMFTNHLNVSSDIRIEMIDNTGKRISTLVDGKYAPGAHSISLDASALAGGFYSLVATTPGFMTDLPVVIRK